MLAVSYCIILDIQNWIMPNAFFTHLFLIYQRWIYFPGIGARKLPAFWQRLVSSSWTRCIQDPSAPESHPTCLSNTYAVSLQKKKNQFEDVTLCKLTVSTSRSLISVQCFSSWEKNFTGHKTWHFQSNCMSPTNKDSKLSVTPEWPITFFLYKLIKKQKKLPCNSMFTGGK